MSTTNVVEDNPKKPYKAIAATVSTFVLAFVTYWIGDEDPFTLKDAGEGLVAGILAGGLTGGATFAIKNPKRTRLVRRH
jgi:hypothetical protein